jgi:hypothetical protein
VENRRWTVGFGGVSGRMVLRRDEGGVERSGGADS